MVVFTEKDNSYLQIVMMKLPLASELETIKKQMNNEEDADSSSPSSDYDSVAEDTAGW